MTLDTAGYDITLSSGTLTSTASGSLLRKEGEGTFTMHTLPPVDDIYVDAGSLALSATVDNTASATRSLAIASGARGWKVKKSADGRTLTFKRVRGTMVIVD